MRKHLITILIISFIAYAFTKHQKKLNLNTKIEDIPTYKFVQEAKSYIQALTVDPPNTNKEEPILNEISSAQKSFGYDDASNQSKKKSDTHQNVNNALGNIAYNIIHTPKGQELLEKILNNQSYNYNGKIMNPYSNNSAIDILKGEGDKVECGDTVQVNYVLRLVNGQEIENTIKSGQSIAFRVGEQQVIKGLEYAVMGMQKGGRKRLVVSPKNAYKKSKLSKGLIAGNEFVTIDVELLDIEPLFKNWRSKVRIYESTESKGRRPVLCSNQVSFNYILSTVEDEVLYKSSEPVGFILGSAMVPSAINKAFDDIRVEEKRTIIFPSNLIYNKNINFLPKNIKIPANKILILDIQTRS